MKLMLAPDVHGSLPAMECVPERSVRNDVRWFIILDDVPDHGPRSALPEGYTPARVTARPNSVAKCVIVIHGNCDSRMDQMLLYFPVTASWQQVFGERYRPFPTHGHLYSPENLPPLDTGDILVYGHTHIPVAERRGTIYLFNPGSVSIPKGRYSASYGLLDQGRLQVLTLNDSQVITEVAIYP